MITKRIKVYRMDGDQYGHAFFIYSLYHYILYVINEWWKWIVDNPIPGSNEEIFIKYS